MGDDVLQLWAISDFNYELLYDLLMNRLGLIRNAHHAQFEHTSHQVLVFTLHRQSQTHELIETRDDGLEDVLGHQGADLEGAKVSHEVEVFAHVNVHCLRYLGVVLRTKLCKAVVLAATCHHSFTITTGLSFLFLHNLDEFE